MCRTNNEQKPKLLLHSCCGPCSTAVIERLIPRFALTVFFYNPNITDRDEYHKRRETQLSFLEKYNAGAGDGDFVGFLPESYDPQRFYLAVAGFEQEPEGGARCTECFRLRLSQTALEAKNLGFDFFATTLSVSPHKNYPHIAQLGEALGKQWGVSFLAEDFKKKAGYQRSIALSKEYGLYRQSYCGCSFAREKS